MEQRTDQLQLRTDGAGLYEITDQVDRFVDQSGLETGLLTVFCRHTSASLTIQENADPDVQRDLQTFFERLVKEDPSLYRHTSEGPDDMPAHIRSALTQSQLTIPVIAGRMVLGTWQGIYLFEHRRAPHGRHVALHIMGGSH